MIDRIATFFLHLFFLVYTLLHLGRGRGNAVILCGEDGARPARWHELPRELKLCLRGSGNRVLLHPGTRFVRPSLMCEGRDACVEIFGGSHLRGLHIFLGGGEGARISVGPDCTTEGVQVIGRGSCGLVIGEDCMFADEVLVRLTDSHPLRDAETGRILNRQTGPLTIGRHTWVGQKACLTKNARIPADTVIGLGSVVTGAFSEEGTCLGGNPARVIRRNVIWSRELES